MKIFIDSAILSEIEEFSDSGILDGVTTNPSLFKKAILELKKKGERENLEQYIKKILKTLGPEKPVSLEVMSSDYDGMIREGLTLFKKFNPTAKNVYVKIPVNPSLKEGEKYLDGIKAIRTLSSKGIPINCTLVFTSEQALMAAKAGAKIVSPFIGRVDDLLRENAGIKFEKSDYYPSEGLEKNGKLLEDKGILSGINLLAEIVNIFRYHSIKSEVLAASIRNTRQLREAALVGADAATAPFYVLKESLEHEKTREGMKKFSNDAISEYVKILETDK